MFRTLGVTGAGFAIVSMGLTLAAGSQGQTSSDGKTLFEKRCGGCHALDRDKEGPRLGGIYGRAAAASNSFQYSDALKKSGIVWTQATLDRWLTDTEKLVPNNDMAFHVENASEREAIIGYLKASSGK